MVIEGLSVSAALGQDLTLRCSVPDYSGSAPLQYEWRLVEGGSVVQARSLSNEYLIPTVRVGDAEAYECRVFESGTESQLVTGTGSLNVSSNACALKVIWCVIASFHYSS